MAPGDAMSLPPQATAISEQPAMSHTSLIVMSTLSRARFARSFETGRADDFRLVTF
jgi:hypothetical protein